MAHAIGLCQKNLDKSRRQPLGRLRQVVRLALEEGGCIQAACLSLTLTTDAQIQQLNCRYRGKDQATDVLAFALEEGDPWPLIEGQPRHLGDVVVSLDTTERQAAEAGHSHQAELAWVICHGTLHLLGFDHQDAQQLEQMRQRERRVLAKMGLERSWPELYPEGSF